MAKQDPQPPEVIEIHLKQTKATKNFVRYDEVVGDEERGHTFYLANAHYTELKSPKDIVVSVEADYEGR